MKIIMQHVSFYLFIVIILASCKKENIPNTQRRIVKFVKSSNGVPISTYNIEYNESGLPSGITGSGGYLFNNKKITYGSNTVTSLNTDASGIFLKKDIVTLNNGTIKNIRELKNQDGSDWFNIEIVCNVNGIPVREIHTASNWTTAYEWVYTFNNEDVVSLLMPGSSNIFYEYYDNKESKQGDPFWLSSIMMYGVEGYQKKTHLLKSIPGGGGFISQVYTYEMNNQDLISKVTKLTGTDQHPEITEYTYD